MALVMLMALVTMMMLKLKLLLVLCPSGQVLLHPRPPGAPRHWRPVL
jgi:hypothetical protein